MNPHPILIVDDEPGILLTVSHALAAVGYSVATADTGAAALARLERQLYSLMLLDLRLPDLSGTEVLRRTRQEHPALPVVVISAFGSIETAVEAMKLGAAHFLQKPFSAVEVRGVVAAVLEPRPTPPTMGDAYDAVAREAARLLIERRFDAAAEQAQRAVALAPVRPEAFNLLGAVLETRGRWLEAQKYYRAALALDSTYEPAERNLARVVSMDKAGPVALGAFQDTGRPSKATSR